MHHEVDTNPARSLVEVLVHRASRVRPGGWSLKTGCTWFDQSWPKGHPLQLLPLPHRSQSGTPQLLVVGRLCPALPDGLMVNSSPSSVAGHIGLQPEHMLDGPGHMISIKILTFLLGFSEFSALHGCVSF